MFDFLDNAKNFVTQLKLGDQLQFSLDFANIVLIFVAIIASIVAFLEFRSNRKHSREETARERRTAERERAISREASAKDLYRDYLKVALDNPDLSTGIYEHNPLSNDRYDTFLSMMLYAFDEMVDLMGPKYWADVVKYQVKVHQKYLREILHKEVPEQESFRSIYGAKLLALVDDAFEEIDNLERSVTPSDLPAPRG
jgi:hypothetical protein